MKMLAINFGGLGDEVLFLPTLSSIKKEHPSWQITLLTEPRSKSITQLSNLIDANICFDIKKRPLTLSDYITLINLLREGKYDLVLSSGSSILVSVLLFLSGIPKRIGYNSGPLSQLLLSSPVPLNRNQYAGFMYHDLIHGLGIKANPEAPRVELDQESLKRMSNFLASSKKNSDMSPGAKPQQIVLLHPGTSRLAIQKGIFKTWSTANWCELIKRLLSMDCLVILAGGPDDEENIKKIEKELDFKNSPEQSHSNFINAYGQTKSVSDLAALMQLCDLIVCVDSAPMHIASGLGKRLVALFGPTEASKLLLQNDRSVAIEEKTEARAKNPSATDVQIPLDIVFRSVRDQLSQASTQESSLEFRRN